MPLCKVIRGTTLHGKALNEGDEVELSPFDANLLRNDVEVIPEKPAPIAEPEPIKPKTSKKDHQP